MGAHLILKEIVTKRHGSVVTESTVRRASPEEIREGMELHKEGRCDHTVVVDEWGPVFSCRTCYICGAHCGYV